VTPVPVLRVDISQVPSPYRPKALTALDFLGLSLGVRIELSPPQQADLRYGGESGDGSAAKVTVPFWTETYDPSAVHHGTLVGGLRCWLPASRPETDQPDLIGSTWRLVSLLDETQVPSINRDAAGAFVTDDLPAGRRTELDQPLAEWHAAALLRQLEHGGVRLGPRVDRWPAGKTYAALVTHDADGPRLQQPGELAKALGKAVVRGSGSEGRAFLAGVRTRLRREPDPYFGFEGWAGAERALGLRSAFYLYVRSTVPRHARDPLYVIDRHPRWDVLRALADDGWELGVHAGIRAAETADGLRQERQRLVDIVGRPVAGLRHHYWRLDWWSPATTFERHSSAGYEYDASMAWRDRPGFRAGTCLPYFPPAGSDDRPLPLVEIPTCLMDGHLFEYLRLDLDAAADSADQLRHRVARAGGVFNIDWHERTFCDSFSYQGWATVALRLLRSLSTDAWLTTPIELARWWRTRSAAVGLPELRQR
jgi:hypothetical protein